MLSSIVIVSFKFHLITIHTRFSLIAMEIKFVLKK